jgi:hypothetical protein
VFPGTLRPDPDAISGLRNLQLGTEILLLTAEIRRDILFADCPRGVSVSGSGDGMDFTGVKVFSATKAKEREELGESVTRWLRSNADLQVVDRVVMQSSDNEFHCLTIILFYREKGAA